MEQGAATSTAKVPVLPAAVQQNSDIPSDTQATQTSPVKHGVYGSYERALVRRVDQVAGGLTNGGTHSYHYEVELLTGNQKNKRFSFVQLPDTHVTSYRPEQGEVAIVFVQPTLDGQDPQIFFEHADRGWIYFLLIVLLALALLIVAGIRGLKTAFNLVMAYACVVWVAVPLLAQGWPPLPTVFLAGGIFTLATLMLCMGWNKKMVTAACSTFGGMAITYAAVAIVGGLANFSGPANSITWAFYEANPVFQNNALLIAGIILATWAIVQDVAVSISSGIAEIKNSTPNADLKDLFRAGMLIGRDHLSTMAPILLFVSLGASLAALLLNRQIAMPWLYSLSSDALAQALILSLSSLLGLILSVPAAASCSAVFWTRSFRRLDPLRRATSWRQVEEANEQSENPPAPL